MPVNWGNSGITLAQATEGVGISGFSQTQVSITHPVPAIPVTLVGTGTPDLDPALVAANYVTVLNNYEFIRSKGDAFTVIADGRVQINYDGAVTIDAYADMSHTSNSATVGAVFSIERGGSTVLSARSVHALMPNTGDIGNISGNGSTDLLAGDIVGIALASDKSGDINIRSSSLVFEYFG